MEREESSETEWWKVKEAADKRRHSTKTLDKRNRATERRQRITKKYKRCKKKKTKQVWETRSVLTENHPELGSCQDSSTQLIILSFTQIFTEGRVRTGCFTVTGLQMENVTKYAVLSRNCCIIDARVGSSSYCLSAEGITLCESGRWSHPKRQNDCWINLRGHHLWHTLLSPPPHWHKEWALGFTAEEVK